MAGSKKSSATNQASGGAQNAYSNEAAQYAAQQAQNRANMAKWAGQGGSMAPWESAGKNDLSQYQNALNQMQNPQAFYQQLMSGYTESPQAKYAQQQGIQAANAAGTASGMLGSGAEQTALQQQGQNITQQDQQNYLNNMMGIHNQYLAGMGGLQQQSMGANQYGMSQAQQAQEYLQGLNSNINSQAANATGQSMAAQTQGQNSKNSGIMGGIAQSMGGGGKGSASSPKESASAGGTSPGGGQGDNKSSALGDIGSIGGGIVGGMYGGPIGAAAGSEAGGYVGNAL